MFKAINIKYSFIIPLYNRPDEIRELLESLCLQDCKDFEVLVIEDGSAIRSEEIVNAFRNRLDVHYYFKENGGQGFARNYGFERAKGEFFIVLDSDVIVPAHYLESIETFRKNQPIDAFGGPDAAHPSFTVVQRAISYSMTSLFTTGGIRGNKKHLGKFHPRSFNMGFSRLVYEKTKGYIIPRLGEDLEFAVRIIKSGFSVALIPDAFVYHKRRTDLIRFWNQLSFFGKSRINLSLFHPEELKLIHWFPFLFLCYCITCVLMAMGGLFKIMLTTGVNQSFAWIIWFIPLFFLSAWKLLIFGDALIKSRNPFVASISVITSWIQLSAYGLGFIREYIRRVIFKKGNNASEYPS